MNKAGKMAGKMESEDKMHMKEYKKEKNRHEKMEMVNENAMAKGKTMKKGSILAGYGDNVTSYDSLMKKCCGQ
jgi:hypothetical protein